MRQRYDVLILNNDDLSNLYRDLNIPSDEKDCAWQKITFSLPWLAEHIVYTTETEELGEQVVNIGIDTHPGNMQSTSLILRITEDELWEQLRPYQKRLNFTE